MTEEVFRWVVGYEGRYEVSDHGTVRSWVARNGGDLPHVLAQHPKSSGHLLVHIHKDGEERNAQVHRLVTEAFLGTCPDGMVVRHLDGDPENNHISNLTYGTLSDNVNDSVRHGTHGQARKTHCKYGHPFSRENTEIKNGRRVCCECAYRWHVAQKNAERKRSLSPMEAEYGRVVKEARKARGMTLADLGAAIGVTRQTMWKIENGHRVMSFHEATILCRALGIDLNDVANGSRVELVMVGGGSDRTFYQKETDE